MDYLLRQQTAAKLRQYADQIDLPKLVSEHGVPLLVLNTAIVASQYRLLQAKMPGIKFHYALKAHTQIDIVRTIASLDGCIDVATQAEIDMALEGGVPADHLMHSHPIKKPSEIAVAYAAGIRIFVIENHAELQKFVDGPKDVRLLVRLSFPNNDAKSNLSYKFGAEIHEAKELVAVAVENGLKIAGFTLHVGSQMPRSDAYTYAIDSTVKLMDELEAAHQLKFEILNIGGGFPIVYREPVPGIDEIAAAINEAIKPLEDRVEIFAEPGRFVVGPAAVSVSSVVGVAQRYGKPWYYLDDGLYGNYGNIIWEDTHPAILAVQELEGSVPAEEFHSSVIAGPTCDSVDIVASDYLMPQLAVGDYVFSPNMGAYTVATSTNFNSIPRPKTVVIDMPNTILSSEQ